MVSEKPDTKDVYAILGFLWLHRDDHKFAVEALEGIDIPWKKLKASMIYLEECGFIECSARTVRELGLPFWLRQFRLTGSGVQYCRNSEHVNTDTVAISKE